jgi:predicted AAA+ superfamily ATPase
MAITRAFNKVLLSRLNEPLGVMQIVLGPRQVGKTTGVKQVFAQWKGSKHFASADLPAPPDSNWILQQWNIATALPGPVLLALDEVQKIPRWSETVKMLFDRTRDERRLRVVLLGSASLSLESGLGESLAGRYELIRVPHWGFEESIRAFKWDLYSYLQFGGYPAAADFAGDPERWQSYVRDAIIEPNLSKDIFGLVSIRKPALFRQVMELAMHHPAQILSYQKMLGQIQEPENISTIKGYLEILEQAFLLRQLQSFSENIIRERASTPKLLPLCPALVHGFVHPTTLSRDSSWRGRMIELSVGASLVQRFQNVFYWRKRNAEVDYIVRHNEKLYAIEVKAGRTRSNSGMAAFLKEAPDAIPVEINSENIESFLIDSTTLLPLE